MIEVKIKMPAPPPDAMVKLKARRTLDGSILITDHEDIDIVIVPAVNKILAMPKDEMTDDVYETQDRFYKFMSKNGVILMDSVQAGNIYGVMEAMYPPDADGKDHVQIILYTIDKFMKSEEPFFAFHRAYKETELQRLLEPTEEESTELGEVPHEEKKGSLPRKGDIFHSFRGY